MINSITLSPRLQTIADQIPRGKFTTDVGTDHGYIPLWLLKNEVTQNIVASDISSRPLERAKKFAEANDASDRIKFILCDGLSGIAPSEAEVVIIAGMGGETISGILSRAPWTKACEKLILQPMTKTDVLRDWLFRNGYEISDECLVKDSGKLYCIISAKGKTDAKVTEVEPWELLVNPILLEKADPLLSEYLQQQQKKTLRMISGLTLSEKEIDGEKLSRQREILNGLKKLEEKVKNAKSS